MPGGGNSSSEYTVWPSARCRQAQSLLQNIHKVSTLAVPLPELIVYNFFRRFGESLYIFQVLPGVVCAVPEADVPPTPAALPHYTGIPHIHTVLYCTVHTDQLPHGTLLVILERNLLIIVGTAIKTYRLLVLVPRRLFFAAQQRIAITSSPNYYQKIHVLQRERIKKNMAQMSCKFGEIIKKL